VPHRRCEAKIGRKRRQWIDRASESGLDYGGDALLTSVGKLESLRKIEALARENATSLWTEKPLSGSLEHLLALLELIDAAIHQRSSRKTRLLLNIVFGKTASALSIAGTTSAVATVGVASTGTPIATLSGAASTSAILYWIGSTIGLGAAAGGAILGGAGIGIGVFAGILGRRKLVGKPRDDAKLQEYERDILNACGVLADALRKQIASRTSVPAAEMRFVAKIALLPLTLQIDEHWDDASLQNSGKPECSPFSRTLALLHRHNLNLYSTELRRISTAAIKAYPGQ
jgi:hypothetical protein